MRILLVLLVVAALTGCCEKAPETTSPNAAAEASAHAALENYVNAINSNNLDTLLEMLTDDVVFMAEGTPVMVGKESVKPWVAGYYEAFKTHWSKQALELEVCGEWAFERYSAQFVDTSKADGSVYEGTSWGLAIYHYDADGKWRVARDAWGSDQPVTE